MNSASIGIELDNNGEEPFADAQIARLLRLLGELKARYRIPSANFLGHGDVAPGRKIDPGVRFPWRRLAAAGFGLWCEIPLDEGQGSDGQIADSLRVAEVNRGLQTLGYDVTDPAAALAAFRRHFWGIDAATAPDFNDLRMLNCLIAQKSMPARRSAADASSDAGRDGP